MRLCAGVPAFVRIRKYTMIACVYKENTSGSEANINMRNVVLEANAAKMLRHRN